MSEGLKASDRQERAGDRQRARPGAGTVTRLPAQPALRGAAGEQPAQLPRHTYRDVARTCGEQSSKPSQPSTQRAADAAAYGSPEYKRNRAVVMRRANGTCADCGHKHRKLQCDHVAPKSETGRPDNSLSNLQALCTREAGGCGCHEKKSHEQRRGARRTRVADPPFTPRTKW